MAKFVQGELCFIEIILNLSNVCRYQISPTRYGCLAFSSCNLRPFRTEKTMSQIQCLITWIRFLTYQTESTSVSRAASSFVARPCKGQDSSLPMLSTGSQALLKHGARETGSHMADWNSTLCAFEILVYSHYSRLRFAFRAGNLCCS